MNLKQQFLEAIYKEAVDINEAKGELPEEAIIYPDELAETCEAICVVAIINALKNVFGEDEEKQPDIVYWQNVKKELTKGAAK